MDIFLSFVKIHEDKNGKKQIDCSAVIDTPCYEYWLQTRKRKPMKPEETFRKAILSHITCTDGGSQPFPEHIEGPMLKTLRKSGRVWPCFVGVNDENDSPIKIGMKGLRCLGFHEQKKFSKSS
jgi:hypothetical protein